MASSFKFNYNKLITTTQGTHMMQVVCQLQSTRTLENSQDFCFGPSRSVPIFLKFKPGPGATDFRGQARFRLQARLEPGTIIMMKRSVRCLLLLFRMQALQLSYGGRLLLRWGIARSSCVLGNLSLLAVQRSVNLGNLQDKW